MTITTHSETETSDVGRRLAETLRRAPSSCWSAIWEQGRRPSFAVWPKGWASRREEVSSPTFTLMQEYRDGRVPLIHVDLYRLNDPREIDELGLEELGLDSVLAIEWAEKLPRPIDGAIEVRIEHGEAADYDDGMSNRATSG